MTEVLPPCEDEDPEAFAGEVIPDPWVDSKQADWPNEEVNVGGDSGSGTSTSGT